MPRNSASQPKRPRSASPAAVDDVFTDLDSLPAAAAVRAASPEPDYVLSSRRCVTQDHVIAHIASSTTMVSLLSALQVGDVNGWHDPQFVRHRISSAYAVQIACKSFCRDVASFLDSPKSCCSPTAALAASQHVAHVSAAVSCLPPLAPTPAASPLQKRTSAPATPLRLGASALPFLHSPAVLSSPVLIDRLKGADIWRLCSTAVAVFAILGGDGPVLRSSDIGAVVTEVLASRPGIAGGCEAVTPGARQRRRNAGLASPSCHVAPPPKTTLLGAAALLLCACWLVVGQDENPQREASRCSATVGVVCSALGGRGAKTWEAAVGMAMRSLCAAPRCEGSHEPQAVTDVLRSVLARLDTFLKPLALLVTTPTLTSGGVTPAVSP